MQTQTNIPTNELEGKKKLFMKWALNSVRKFFNNNQLPYHLLSTCVSIKPGSANRCATLQSYPNQGVWKYLKELPESVRRDLTMHLNNEMKLVEFKFQQSILIEFKDRILKDFDFSSFYKESKNFNDNNEIPFIESDQNEQQVKQKKWCKGQDFVSESKQILIQMQLCNRKPPLIHMKQLHYHKLRTLLEKIKEHKFSMSEEMKQFKHELEQFCKQDFCQESEKKKKVKANHDQQQNELEKVQQNCIIKVEDEDNKNDILRIFKQRVKSIEPGISLFLPDLSKFEQQMRNNFQEVEDNYYKNLYFKEKVEEMELNSKNILAECKQYYEALQFKEPRQKIEVQPDRR
ncbi:unnamed protein product (macronuclear) [Paramecium tetraurelia]|uniref:CDT1 Geminin-binding domain-containing protein n=1 Tax=Paramecium tetraurelia TaxID=5888 RepID=A0EFA4_PARTE|nr:uncharacterized protein GSPATT00026318001 [Paramecium tetraurelia]CAK93995.1 unnamed protein product [Paramecium tetraurelia]|eukprot:XP_001461368.1 hypothetical protein (macronuclear) [Paramecium tetraurelia strain d4-2]